jgi:predicted homoserine dehydrogenase-like protein
MIGEMQMTLKDELRMYAEKNGPVRIGLIGAGQMGTGLISQVERMVGMRVVATADVIPGRSVAAYHEASVDPAIVVEIEDDADRAAKAIDAGRRVATQHADWLASIPNLDLIFECTGIPEVGARVCEDAINAGKPVVNMNVETDATIGYILAKRAKEAGVAYSLAAGDEPGSIKELFDFADALGFEIVTVAKGKNNPLDRTANPDTVADRARQQNMSAKMLAGFVDGTKTMVEMTSIGNGTGFAPEVPGAYGPHCNVKDLPKVFVPKEAGGIFNAKGAVDYVVGDVAPGVFIIITTDQPKVIADMNYLKVNGHNNYWALYRPYHLCNLEAPITIAQVAVRKHITLATHQPPVAETVAVAKRDLKKGDRLDSLGGFTMYGLIDRADNAHKDEMLPLGLAVGAEVQRPVKAGEVIHYSDVLLNENQAIVRLRREQDRMVYSGAN